MTALQGSMAPLSMTNYCMALTWPITWLLYSSDSDRIPLPSCVMLKKCFISATSMRNTVISYGFCSGRMGAWQQCPKTTVWKSISLELPPHPAVPTMGWSTWLKKTSLPTPLGPASVNEIFMSTTAWPVKLQWNALSMWSTRPEPSVPRATCGFTSLSLTAVR